MKDPTPAEILEKARKADAEAILKEIHEGKSPSADKMARLQRYYGADEIDKKKKEVEEAKKVPVEIRAKVFLIDGDECTQQAEVFYAELQENGKPSKPTIRTMIQDGRLDGKKRGWYNITAARKKLEGLTTQESTKVIRASAANVEDLSTGPEFALGRLAQNEKYAWANLEAVHNDENATQAQILFATKMHDTAVRNYQRHLRVVKNDQADLGELIAQTRAREIFRAFGRCCARSVPRAATQIALETEAVDDRIEIARIAFEVFRNEVLTLIDDCWEQGALPEWCGAEIREGLGLAAKPAPKN